VKCGQHYSVKPEPSIMEKEGVLPFVTPGADRLAVSEGHDEKLFSTFDASEATVQPLPKVRSVYF